MGCVARILAANLLLSPIVKEFSKSVNVAKVMRETIELHVFDSVQLPTVWKQEVKVI